MVIQRPIPVGQTVELGVACLDDVWWMTTGKSMSGRGRTVFRSELGIGLSRIRTTLHFFRGLLAQ